MCTRRLADQVHDTDSHTGNTDKMECASTADGTSMVKERTRNTTVLLNKELLGSWSVSYGSCVSCVIPDRAYHLPSKKLERGGLPEARQEASAG